jgi:2-polyprenyl-3-methyl-5-hydroxy-6-metoxy-1,4-benzoquinol methylase
VDISFVRKEEQGSAIEMNDVETANKAWSDPKISSRFLSKSVLERCGETVSILKSHDIDLSGKSVMDVGCGNGMLLKFLADNYMVSSQTGMEYAEAAVEVARKVHPEADYIVHDINIAFEHKYDAVLSTEVLEHILHPGKAFRNLLDMVQDEGVLFLTVPNGRFDTFFGHINFWSPESWDVFIDENAGGLRYSTGELEKILLYVIVYKKD